MGGAIAAAGLAAPAVAAEAAPPPRIVLQAADAAGVEVAAWFPDGRHLATASATSRTLLVWDVTTGLIVRRQPVPVGGEASVVARFDSLSVERSPFAPPSPHSETDLSLIATSISMQGVARPYLEIHQDGTIGVSYPEQLQGAGGGQAIRASRRLERRTRNPDVKQALADHQKEQLALAVIYEGAGGMTRASAEAILPKLPKSPDGRFSLRRDLAGLQILDASGAVVRTLSAGAPMAYVAAALSPDGTRLVLVDDLKRRAAGKPVQTVVHGFDIRRSTPARDVVLDGDYAAVTWLDNDRYLVTPDWSAEDRDSADRTGVPPPARVVEAATGAVRETFPSFCYLAPLPGGGYVAAPLANCRGKAAGGPGLLRRDAAGAWTPFLTGPTRDRFVNAVAVSPDGRRIAVLLEARRETVIHLPERSMGSWTARAEDVLAKPQSIVVADLQTGAVERTIPLDVDADPILLAFSADGAGVVEMDPGAGQLFGRDGKARRLEGRVGTWSANDGAVMLSGGILYDEISRIDLKTGANLPGLPAAGVVAGGFVPGRPLFWAVSAVDGVRLFDTRTWTPIVTTYQFEGGGYLTTAADGRYDTNLGADSDRFRWVFADDPFNALAPQTFMRDYYEPRLAQRLLDCTETQSCAAVFPPVRALASLNRVLPVARVVDVRPGPAPGAAVVDVKVEEGAGAKPSGLYDLRLFRDGRLVAERPGAAAPLEAHSDTARWREANRLQPGLHSFTVALPTDGPKEVTFTAYAFNEDRVKGDTARRTYPRPAGEARKPQAFVVAIGENAYEHADWNLNFAAADAELTARQLARIPGHEGHVLTLVADGATAHARKAQVRDALALLAGGADGEAARKRLAAAGLPAEALAGFRKATPDDVVILAFSGHGWAVKHGDFYLLPSDAQYDPATRDPRPDSLISTAELTAWLRDVDAGEMAFILDACHSAASVEAEGFKAGPFGDAGLGQLAFDKGIRILAASQAADVALEDARLKHGLLTAALSEEGLDDKGFGKADLDGDGRITLDEWLRYAVRRLPGLSVELQGGRKTRDVDLDEAPAAAAPAPKAQEPALFDFTGHASPVVLRTAAAASAAAPAGRAP